MFFFQDQESEDSSGASDEEGEESDNLDWLPDPDKIYGKTEEQEKDETSDEETPKPKKMKKESLEDLALKLLTG